MYKDVIDLFDEFISGFYFSLKHSKYKSILNKYLRDYVDTLASSEELDKIYTDLIKYSVYYDLISNYLYALSLKDKKLEDTNIKYLVFGKNKAKLIVKSRSITTFLLLSALTGSYVYSRLINPYATMQIKAILASLYYDIMLNKVKMAKEALDMGNVEEAKNILENILEVDSKNVFNTVIPLPDLIEYVKLNKESKIKSAEEFYIKSIYGEVPLVLLRAYLPVVYSLTDERDMKELIERIRNLARMIRKPVKQQS